jgi:hypothetical protein
MWLDTQEQVYAIASLDPVHYLAYLLAEAMQVKGLP